MSETKWSDAQVEQYLRSLTYADALPDAPALSPELAGRALAAPQRRRAGARWKVGVAAAAVAGLLLVGSNSSMVADAVERILGVGIRNMTQQEYAQRVSGDWPADMPMPEYYSPEETAQLATFPLRSPAWVPEGFTLLNGPAGAFEWLHTEDGQWELLEDPEHFYVTEAYQSADGRRIHIRQSLFGEAQWISWPPGTEQLEVAGHPAFLREDVEPVHVEPPEGVEPTDDWTPDSLNLLYLWVEEPDGRITEITLDGDVDPEVLIQVAESLFAGDGSAN
ncbi:hypothetical protein [Symbiobacterium thermophilum]|uniref:DUF4367 domain-containing protein n=1 Tax=Symbiobacterium thermophilum (strain DSM 24528 / JCM 14929 / IAM 14863 / T) TaxID=292459 RepID=Q67QA5_SYMTH|nr:hypothetical protein [Symbiobacterium thermophilum]BAD40138.1 hypothetical protein STH1153 [Symbiobacterium thermophilum IAM 14863]